MRSFANKMFFYLLATSLFAVLQTPIVNACQPGSSHKFTGSYPEEAIYGKPGKKALASKFYAEGDIMTDIRITSPYAFSLSVIKPTPAGDRKVFDARSQHGSNGKHHYDFRVDFRNYPKEGFWILLWPSIKHRNQPHRVNYEAVTVSCK